MKLSVKFYHLILFVIVFLLLFSFPGKAKASGGRPTYYRYNIFDKITYLEMPPTSSLADAKFRTKEFKKLNINDRKNLTNLLEDKSNYIWLKIEFHIPSELKMRDIGLYIGRLHSSSQLYLNNRFVRKYGNTPPTEMTAGFMSQYYMFSRNDLKYNGVNTIYIQVWPGPMGSISKNIFLSEQADVFPLADRNTFFSSKIIIAFACISFFISFLYLLLSFVLRKYDEHKRYLMYALTNFYTFHFLLLFLLAEVSWLKPPFISFLTIIKLTICYGGFSTVFFASSFMISYLGYVPHKKETIFRVILFVIPVLVGLAIPTYEAFAKFIPFLIVATSLQFCFSMPRLCKDLLSAKKRKNAFHMLQGFFPVLAALIADLICHIVLDIDDVPFITLYGWQITIYVFLWQLINQFGGMYIHNLNLKTQLQDFNSNLESVVALRTKELSEANYVLSRGLETVSHVQRNFLPPESNIFRGWDLSVYYKPLDNNVSGDLYDYYFTDATLDGLGIFDVSGHGIPAGLMTILAKGIITQHFLNGLAQEESISNILKEINTTYIREKVNVENYITGLLFHFSDFNKNDVCSVEVANAGHPYPILYNAEKDTFTEIKHDNPDEQYGIIGVEGLDVSFPPVSFRMGKDDIIVCFTDGLTESMNLKKESFSKQRIIDIIAEHKYESAAEINKIIIDTLKEFTNNQPFTDDITVIVLKRTDSKEYIEEI